MLSVMSAASQIKPAKFAGCFRSVWRFGGSDNRPEITTFQVFQRLFNLSLLKLQSFVSRVDLHFEILNVLNQLKDFDILIFQVDLHSDSFLLVYFIVRHF